MKQPLYTLWSKYMAQSPKGGLVHGLYNPIHGDCAIHFYPGVMVMEIPSGFFHGSHESRSPQKDPSPNPPEKIFVFP